MQSRLLSLASHTPGGAAALAEPEKYLKSGRLCRNRDITRCPIRFEHVETIGSSARTTLATLVNLVTSRRGTTPATELDTSLPVSYPSPFTFQRTALVVNRRKVILRSLIGSNKVDRPWALKKTESSSRTRR